VKIKVPKSGGGEEEISVPKVLTIVGTNGSGKTRF